MPKFENCGWYPGKIAKIKSVEVVVGVDTLLFLATRSLPRRLGFGSGRGLDDPSLEKATFDDILLDYCFILLYKPYTTIQAL